MDRAGVDLLVVETMMSLQECRAAVIAAKEVTTLPIMVTLSFNEDGRTLFGTNPETADISINNIVSGCDRYKLFDRSGKDDTGYRKECQNIRTLFH